MDFNFQTFGNHSQIEIGIGMKPTLSEALFPKFSYGSSSFLISYSRVPIRRGVRNKRSGSQDEKYMRRSTSHMCLGLYSRCRFILTNLYLKVLHFDILIQLNSTAHFSENVLGRIKGVCRINVPCLLIGTRERNLGSDVLHEYYASFTNLLKYFKYRRM